MCFPMGTEKLVPPKVPRSAPDLPPKAVKKKARDEKKYIEKTL